MVTAGGSSRRRESCRRSSRERNFGVIDHPEPLLEGPTDMRAQVLEVGVCGTDRPAWNGA
jgi:threonine dehydrogenase-like Zn-dependent dehydrogenase